MEKRVILDIVGGVLICEGKRDQLVTDDDLDAGGCQVTSVYQNT